MLLVYAPSDSPRLRYTLQLIFHDLLSLTYEFTADVDRFAAFSGPRLNYSQARIADVPFIHHVELLFSHGIIPLKVRCGEYNRITTLFHHDDASSDLPFDPLAATFYLVSRYEEYLPFEADKHGRFPAEESLNYKKGFYQQPVVNHYAMLIRQLLMSKYPELVFPENIFRFELTYDIDMAYAYREKGAFRNAGGYLRSFRNLNLNEIAQRTLVLTGLEDDPFDTFDFQQQLHDRYQLQPTYFFLLGNHGDFDKNIDWRNAAFNELLKRLSSNHETGIHASYASNDSLEILEMEKSRLEDITGKQITRNRQHFLKLQLPETYQHLIAAGITDDYTMGYPSQTGFRAGIAHPFYFYDLSKEAATSLHIHPFTVMDAAMFYYLKLDAASALKQSQLLIDAVKKVGGTFGFLAHNDLISRKGPWSGWSEHFEMLLRYAKG